jgi:DHA2 family multidrug resistance protein
LVDNFSWQLIFNVNIPIGIVALLFTILIQREYINKKLRKFDTVGFISVVVFLPVLLYALSEGNASTNSQGWSAPYILACFAISTIAFAVFITRELTINYPLIDLKLLANRNFGFSNLVIFIFSMGMFGSTFLLPLYLQNSMNYTALQSGAIFLPVGIIQGFMSPVAGIVADKFNPKIPILIGILLLVISFYLNSDLSFLTEKSFIMSSLYIRGFAMGIIFTPLNKISFLTISHDKMAQASSITNTIRQIGGSVGVAFLTTMLTSRISFHSQVYNESIQMHSQEFRNVAHHLALFAQQHLGSDLHTALKQGQYLLLSNVSKQAFIQGIDDDFLLASLITLLGIIPVVILKIKKKNVNNQHKTESQ